MRSQRIGLLALSEAGDPSPERVHYVGEKPLL